MGIKETVEKVILNGKTAIAILLVAIVWRIFISLDGDIALWESLLSGTPLIILGWILFAYLYHLSKELKGWLISNYIYLGFAVCVLIINFYALIYYALRWYKLLSVEAYLPYDFMFRGVRYIALVMFYCSIIWSTGHLKRMHEEYVARSKEKSLLHIISPYIYTRVKKLREMGYKELIGALLTDERTLLVIVGLTFLWRMYISLDYKIALWESASSGIALMILGWLFFAYVVSLIRKEVDWSDLVKVYRNAALGVFAINIYVLLYYGMRWYTLAGLGISEALVPIDFLFRDLQYFALVMFYCASIVLSKFLKRSYEEHKLLFAEVSRKAPRK
ncbi:MAG: hypothetical protein EFT35_06275 [Methanophagales archaeon ANME-1-THS]|nr:MAG: hypothetical protein EFT35_06275 [Methanophagales archaeon ANME-1-THS]